jgi:hypothetical protein
VKVEGQKATLEFNQPIAITSAGTFGSAPNALPFLNLGDISNLPEISLATSNVAEIGNALGSSSPLFSSATKLV